MLSKEEFIMEFSRFDQLKDQFQGELHLATKDGDDNVLVCRHFSIPYKTAWTKPIQVDEGTKEGSESVYTHHINTKGYDFLTGVNLNVLLPSISVKKECQDFIRICWPHNVGHHIIEESLFFADSKKYQRISNTYLDSVRAFLQHEKQETYDKLIGSISSLEEWSSFLPKYQLSIPQPFFYSADQYSALPLFASMQSIMSHDFKIRTIPNLLRIQKKVDDIWEDISFVDASEYLKDVKETFNTPTVTCFYNNISDGEKEAILDKDYSIYVDNVITLTSQNHCTLGSNCSISLHAKVPCRAIFLKAIPSNVSKTKNYGNYTNSENFRNGSSVIKSVTLNVDGKEYIEFNSTALELVNPYRYFPSCSKENGYGAISLSVDPFSIDKWSGVTFVPELSSYISVSLSNSDSYGKSSYHEDFIVIVDLIVTRKLKFSKGKMEICYE